ncbi:IS630 family transposase [Streptomyces antibioticus]|uniref:IS630 family transposase n=1 Tax=Streptomyces antibioticus TaxID=1890 RepID=UPI0033AF7002
MRRLTDQEGQKLQQIVRRGSTSSVRYRRAMMLLASAGGNRVPVIAQLVQADEDTVRDVIHRFNEIGLACLDPRWAGGRARLLKPDDEEFVVATAITRPAKLGRPFTRWSLRKLVAYLRKVHGRVVRIGREALRCLLARRGITFQRTKTWKESPDPERDTKLDRIEETLDRFPDRVFAFDEFGPLGIRPTAGSGRGRTGSSRPAARHLSPHARSALLPWLPLGRRRHPVGRQLPQKGRRQHAHRAEADPCRPPDGAPIYVILDNLSAHKGADIRLCAKNNKVELCFTPTYASWANPIEAHFGPLRQFTIANSHHPHHTVQTRALHAYLRRRNANARHHDALAAERKERARVRSERGIRWGGRPLTVAA